MSAIEAACFVPGVKFSGDRKLSATKRCTRPARIFMRARADRKTTQLKEQVYGSIKGLDKGFGEAEVSLEEDDEIDDRVADLEDINPTKSARDSEFLIGRWKLIYTTSAMTRFAKGISGIHSLLPLGRCTDVEQVIEPEDFRSYIIEKVQYLNGVLKGDAFTMGQYTWVNDNKLTWQTDLIKLWFLRFQAEIGWRSLGAIKAVEVSYLDYELKIERGEIGQIFIWRRVE